MKPKLSVYTYVTLYIHIYIYVYVTLSFSPYNPPVPIAFPMLPYFPLTHSKMSEASGEKASKDTSVLGFAAQATRAARGHAIGAVGWLCEEIGVIENIQGVIGFGTSVVCRGFEGKARVNRGGEQGRRTGGEEERRSRRGGGEAEGKFGCRGSVLWVKDVQDQGFGCWGLLVTTSTFGSNDLSPVIASSATYKPQPCGWRICWCRGLEIHLC